MYMLETASKKMCKEIFISDEHNWNAYHIYVNKICKRTEDEQIESLPVCFET